MKNSLLVVSAIGTLFAHQPVMDMAPRWSGGWGFQFRYETLGSDRGIGEEYNGLSKSYYRNTTWFEGVYTWKRSIRATFKIPYHKINNERQLIDSANPTLSNSGIGDLILALPLKKYSNMELSTSNFGLTPQIRLKTGGNTNPVTSKSGYGLSLSYSTENPKFYQLYDVFGWTLDDGSKMVGFDINIGWHPIHNNENNSGVFVMWDGTYRLNWDKDENSDSRLYTGPVAVYYKGNIMTRIDIKIPINEKVEKASLSQGTIFQAGIGFVF